MSLRVIFIQKKFVVLPFMITPRLSRQHSSVHLNYLTRDVTRHL